MFLRISRGDHPYAYILFLGPRARTQNATLDCAINAERQRTPIGIDEKQFFRNPERTRLREAGDFGGGTLIRRRNARNTAYTNKNSPKNE